MYKVLIVDDEEIIRRGLAERVDWEGIGFRLVGACADGREAMDVAEREQPDVVLTDICMPAADGLELALWAQDHLPQTIVVILSGYDEFEYAQEAIRRNVAEYLLKPLSSKDIRTLFLRLKERLNSGRAERDRNQNLEALAESASRIRRERAFAALLSGRLTDEEIEGVGASDKAVLSSPLFAVILVDPRAQKGDTTFRSVLSILEEAGRGRLVLSVFAYESDREGGRPLVAALASGTDESALREGLRPYSELAADRVRTEAGEEALLAVGGIGVGRSGAALSRAQAEEALKTSFFGPAEGRPARWEDLPPDEGSSPRLRRSAERLALILSSSLEEAISAVKEFSSTLRASPPRPDRVDLEVRRLVFALLDAAESGGVAIEDLPTLAAIDHTKPFAGFDGLKDLEAALVVACAELWGVLKERRGDSASRRAAEIRRFVADRYADASLSVEAACSELGMSRSYLARIMRKEIGKGFVEYLAAVRMERAKELLRSTDKKLVEIAELVGYADQRYFSSIFKRETGMTTSEFREIP